MQSNVNNVLNSQKGRLESTHLNALKTDVDAYHDKIQRLQHEIITNLNHTKEHFNDFVGFKKEFNENVAPMLNKSNNNYMKGNHDDSVPYGNGQQNASRSKTHATQFIDCEVLFLTDSNLHRMKPEIMNNGTTSQKIFCPTVQDIENVMNNAVIKTKPRQIYISNAAQTTWKNLDSIRII